MTHEPERLVEAELHVFKLFPQLPATIAAGPTHYDNPQVVAGSNHIKASAEFAQESRRGSRRRAASPVQSTYEQPVATANRTTTTTTSGNIYHLKTNLLEVSLYQILPKKATSSSSTTRTSTSTNARTRPPPRPDHEEEFPLRLLDIRRIDLNSNGWETFYVKRAVEDWLRDARLNLGLVIKAKSMFDEPVRVGLIRFADAYDHLEATEPLPSVELARLKQQQQRHLRDFSLSHQPLLVIYTTKSQ